MPTPGVSILMPARDAAPTLEEALSSIAAQTFRDWELIVLDDGSRDTTPEILAGWASAETRLRVVRHEEARGIPAALNAALAVARADVIARMDADDIALPARLERQLDRLESEDTPALVGCQVRYFPEEQVAAGAKRYAAWLNGLVTPEEHARDLFVECPLAHPTFMLRRGALEAVGGYRACGWPEDYDLCFRLWRHGYRMAKVPEVLFLWREGAERASRVHPDYGPDAFRRCKVNYLRESYLAGGRPALVWGAGRVGKLLARGLLEAGTPLHGFVELDPRKIGQSIYGAPVLSLPDALSRRGEAFGLAAVGQAGAREEIRATLADAGWIDGRDFCCVA